MALPRSSSARLLAVAQQQAPRRYIHSSPFRAAVAHPITAHGPPPKAPAPSPEFTEQIEKQTDSKPGQYAFNESLSTKPSVGLKKRFWKDVHVHGKPGTSSIDVALVRWFAYDRSTPGEYQVLLDKRPVRTPTKEVLSIPPTKPHLAHAIALEWDVMTSAQQALKGHLIPLTSLSARAADIIREDAEGTTVTRDQIIKTAMRYLDTDTLLCWEPEREDRVLDRKNEEEKIESLREIQMRVAKSIMSFLSTKVWPGLEIVPILDSESILPVSQPQATKDSIRTWVSELSAHDLAGLERGILAAKSLLVAVRLLVEWSENFRHLQQHQSPKFGLEEAAEAASLEVKWQTDMWGEVEDTHDVDKEDLRRQLGSVVVLVSGETR
ncbi:hypothetical protein N7462_000239 [Penicillium macrosclerotiorum]|uniref:uncharacterized protein n=1 Tax=Penicillium macrosclerotiorum TaxID=303699 RepID=UPI00254991A0|nr:uncharacterized protein N7462_000239 [Penicillium macrosclerotiorum]KAJ5698234.1 hypothetical protein N7462_000239 [Penicillium macrosclerotiorum]